MKKSNQPPRWADKFLRWFCAEDVLETLQGDLYELYGKRIFQRGRLIANLCFIRDVFMYAVLLPFVRLDQVS